MLICHKLVVSNAAAVLQACDMSDVRRACNIGSVYHASVVIGCAPVSASSSLIYNFWFLKHHYSAAMDHHHRRCETQLSYPWKLHKCRANNNYFLYISFYFLIYVFGIVLNCIFRTIVTLYTDNIFLYNYLQQMHYIIHLSPVGSFTPARGKKHAKKTRGKRG